MYGLTLGDPWIAAHQAPLSLTVSQSLFKLMSIESVMPSNHFILCHPLLLLPSIFPSIRSFPTSWLSASGDQSIGASTSASVLAMSTQGWSPLGLIVLISLQSKGLSRAFSMSNTFMEGIYQFILKKKKRVFSYTTVQKHQFFSVKPSLWSNPYICSWLLEKL